MNISFKNIHLKMLSLAAIVVMLASFTACKDELDFGDRDFGDGMAKVSASITFYQNIGNLSSRAEGDETATGGVAGGTPGDAIGAVESLCVLLYTEQEVEGVKEWRLFKSYTKDQLSGYKYTEDANSSTSSNAVGSEEHRAEQKTGQATFKFPTEIPYGTYRIYAVANMGNLAEYKEAIQTEEGLKKIQLEWQANVASNNQMFGYFDILTQGASISSLPSKGFQSDLPLVIDKPNMDLHAWLKRVVSKVTVAFDASKLNDNIWIYIKSVKIKDIPATCYLGADNPGSPDVTPGAAGTEINFAAQEPAITYNTGLEGAPTSSWQYLANAETDPGHTLLGAVDPTGSTPEAQLESLHGETVKALFFYENLQGVGQEGTMTDKRQQVKDDNKAVEEYRPSYPDGVQLNNDAWKDAKKYGSYIEVRAYYVSTNEGDPGQGDIIYRFMLGRDITTDYNAYRNYHYKLTLCFNGYANDIDWHIDYKKQVLEVKGPKVVNYQWKKFDRNEDINNLGYKFDDDNKIKVTSYTIIPAENDKKTPTAIDSYKVSFSNDGGKTFTEGKPDWLNVSEPVSSEGGLVSTYSLSTTPKVVTINNSIGNNGSKIVNLADNRPEASATNIYSTANCYIANATGSYTFPLVYGNAYEEGKPNSQSYNCPPNLKPEDYGMQYDNEGDNKDYNNMKDVLSNGERNRNYLKILKDYVNNDINGPIITDADGSSTGSGWTAELVWQDVQGLITVDGLCDYTTPASCKGIKFTVNKKAEGNAVIAIKDKDNRIMWSWHIWVTSFADLEDNIVVTKSSEAVSDPQFKTFNFLPVNLGWKSGGQPIYYYPGGILRFEYTAGIMTESVEFEIKSHMAFPEGNNLYYQWGRKDPFWSTTAYYANNTAYPDNPQRFYWDSNDNGSESSTPEDRKTTIQIYSESGKNILIQYPYIWHNPPRAGQIISEEKVPVKDENGNELKDDNGNVIMGSKYTYHYHSMNETYQNLWGGTWDIWVATTFKTIYDPCPVGYAVSHYVPFSSFTVSAHVAYDHFDTYDVPQNDEYIPHYKDNQFEFYTDTCKLQSIIFPQSAYRDWDASAQIINPNKWGYIWARTIPQYKSSIQLSEDKKSVSGTPDAANNFEFSRPGVSTAEGGKGYIVYPDNRFNTCNGMPVRPCKILSLD